MECLFCAIASNKVPAKKVYEDDVSVAFLDIHPRNPGHTLVISKKHYEDLLAMPSDEAGRLFQSVKKVAEAAKNGTKADGVSLSQSNGKAAGQVIPHIHFHVIPRFANEGPVGLESILPGKGMDDNSLNQIAEAIQAGFGQAGQGRAADAGKPGEERDEFDFNV